ncbi:MAG: 5-oxoprolinase subunit PxpA [Planctomycetota bacterium]
MRIDLNCDVGESFGAYTLGDDARILEHVTSANIACGFHAGDHATMRQTVRLAVDRNVAIGAHPGLPDLAGFGRRTMSISPQDAYDMVLYQVGALAAFARAEGVTLRHVKPHGALYNMAAKDPELGDAIARAVARFDDALILVGLAGSELIRAGGACGLRTASEAFADRGYEADGTLTPRREANAMIASTTDALEQCRSIVMNGTVLSRQGTVVNVHADTLCIHGDSPQAVELAAAVRAGLQALGVEIQPLG